MAEVDPLDPVHDDKRPEHGDKAPAPESDSADHGPDQVADEVEANDSGNGRRGMKHDQRKQDGPADDVEDPVQDESDVGKIEKRRASADAMSSNSLHSSPHPSEVLAIPVPQIGWILYGSLGSRCVGDAAELASVALESPKRIVHDVRRVRVEEASEHACAVERVRSCDAIHDVQT